MEITALLRKFHENYRFVEEVHGSAADEVDDGHEDILLNWLSLFYCCWSIYRFFEEVHGNYRFVEEVHGDAADEVEDGHGDDPGGRGYRRSGGMARHSPHQSQL